MDFQIDGKALLDTLILASAEKANDKLILAIAPVLQRHGISLLDGLALLFELTTAIEGLKDEGDE